LCRSRQENQVCFLSEHFELVIKPIFGRFFHTTTNKLNEFNLFLTIANHTTNPVSIMNIFQGWPNCGSLNLRMQLFELSENIFAFYFYCNV